MNTQKPQRRRSLAKAALASLPALFLFASLPAWSQSIREDESGRLSIIADQVPLSELFHELSSQGWVEAALIDPEIGSVRVTLEAHDLTPGNAIMSILEASDVAFTLRRGSGKSFRVVLEPAGETERRPLAPTPPSPPEGNEAPNPSLYQPALQPEVTGDAEPATGAAGVDGPPDAAALGLVSLVLVMGLLLGAALVSVGGRNPRRDRGPGGR